MNSVQLKAKWKRIQNTHKRSHLISIRFDHKRSCFVIKKSGRKYLLMEDDIFDRTSVFNSFTGVGWLLSLTTGLELVRTAHARKLVHQWLRSCHTYEVCLFVHLSKDPEKTFMIAGKGLQKKPDSQ